MVSYNYLPKSIIPSYYERPLAARFDWGGADSIRSVQIIGDCRSFTDGRTPRTTAIAASTRSTRRKSRPFQSSLPHRAIWLSRRRGNWEDWEFITPHESLQPPPLSRISPLIVLLMNCRRWRTSGRAAEMRSRADIFHIAWHWQASFYEWKAQYITLTNGVSLVH